MNYIGKTVSAVKGAFRKVTIYIFGSTDARSAPEFLPYGIDSCPIPGMQALYIQTSVKGQPVICGYANADLIKNITALQQVAEPGESRIYATDTNGNLKFNIWVRNDGTILMGTSVTPAEYIDNLVKWQGLSDGLSTYLADLNTAIAAGVSSAGGAYTPPVLPLDITAAKFTAVKTQ